MDEGDSKNNKQAEKQGKQNNAVQGYGIDAGSILQSSWIRRSAVLANCFNWESMERQYCFVLCGGTILWAIHLATLFI